MYRVCDCAPGFVRRGVGDHEPVESVQFVVCDAASLAADPFGRASGRRSRPGMPGGVVAACPPTSCRYERPRNQGVRQGSRGGNRGAPGRGGPSPSFAEVLVGDSRAGGGNRSIGQHDRPRRAHRRTGRSQADGSVIERGPSQSCERALGTRVCRVKQAHPARDPRVSPPAALVFTRFL